MPNDFDPSFFDAMHAFGPPSDPAFDDSYNNHRGVGYLRTARAYLTDDLAELAVQATQDALRIGLPAELMPYASAVLGASLSIANDTDAAITVLRAAWREYPDFAALPALLGCAYLLAKDTESAAHIMHAALACEDPDRTIAILKPLISQLLRITQRPV